jgi:hypothetical protein
MGIGHWRRFKVQKIKKSLKSIDSDPMEEKSNEHSKD